MTATATATAAQIRTEAIEHRVALIVWRTREIKAAEAVTGEWDADLLRNLYAARLSVVIEALAMGVTAEYISTLTGVGRN